MIVAERPQRLNWVGGRAVAGLLELAAAAYNLVRLRRLAPAV